MLRWLLAIGGTAVLAAVLLVVAAAAVPAKVISLLEPVPVKFILVEIGLVMTRFLPFLCTGHSSFQRRLEWH